MQNYIFKTSNELNSYFAREVKVVDLFTKQLKELVVCENPGIKNNESKISERLRAFDHVESRYIYYPWLNTAYRILPEREFIMVRTNRNQLKITREEQMELSGKKIAVAGLSVGNAVALTCAMERVCGAFHLADYDRLELSNLNRLRAGIPDYDLPKTEMVYRQLLELDPYLELKTFIEGVTEENVEHFLDDSVDALVEVCDNIELKFLLRKRAKELKIPVIMDTNDRGMIDIERFDLEPDRPLFHGSVEHLDTSRQALRDPNNKLKIVQALIGNSLSPRLKQSMPEIGSSLCSWPQLASGVMLGGAATAHVCRRIFLNDDCPSGRFYVDLADIIKA